MFELSIGMYTWCWVFCHIIYVTSEIFYRKKNLLMFGISLFKNLDSFCHLQMHYRMTNNVLL